MKRGSTYQIPEVCRRTYPTYALRARVPSSRPVEKFHNLLCITEKHRSLVSLPLQRRVSNFERGTLQRERLELLVERVDRRLARAHELLQLLQVLACSSISFRSLAPSIFFLLASRVRSCKTKTLCYKTTALASP